MMKSKINMILLGILSVCVIGLLALILTYFVMSSKVKKKQSQPAAQQAVTQADNTAAPAEPADTQAEPEAQPPVEEVPASGDSSMIYKQPGGSVTSSATVQPGEVPPAQPAVDTATKLYLLYEETPVYIQPEGAEKAVVDYPDLTLSGMFTGREYAADTNYTEIDYRDQKALVPTKSLIEMGGSTIIKAGVVAQISDGIGYSASAPACLYLMSKSSGLQPKNVSAASYSGLLHLAEEYGYCDRGSIYNYGGGVSTDMLIKLANDMYGAELVNLFDQNKKPADVIKEALDNGKQAIVLIHSQDGQMTDNGETSQFVLFTGYTVTQGAVEFIYANTFEEINYNLGVPLQKASAELVNISAGAQFEGESNTILCIR